MGEPELLLRQLGEVRREDHEAGVAGPARRVERAVVLGEIGVAAVAEDALDEVEVGHEGGGREEPGLHPHLLGVARYLGHDDGPQEQRRPARGALLAVGGVGEDHGLGRRGERVLEQAAEDGARHGQLVGLDGQTALGDGEDALGGAPVVGRIGKDAVDEAVAGELRGGERVAVVGETHHAGEPRLVEHERLAGELGRGAGALEVGVEERLHAAVDGGKPVLQAPVQLALTGEDGAHEIDGLAGLSLLRQRDAEEPQSKVNCRNVREIGHAPLLRVAPVTEKAARYKDRTGRMPRRYLDAA